jgi:hypothetical protein
MNGGEERGKGREETRQGDDHCVLEGVEALFKAIETGIDMSFKLVEAAVDLLEPLVDLLEPLVDLLGEVVEAVVIPIGF